MNVKQETPEFPGRASHDTLIRTMAYRVARRSDFMHPDAMLAELTSTAEPQAVREALAMLEQRPERRAEIAVLYLSEGWQDDRERAEIVRTMADVDGSLPNIDHVLEAVVALYVLYLTFTGGRKRTSQSIERRPDGSFKVTETTEYADPAPWIDAIGTIFRGLRQADAELESGASEQPELDSGADDSSQPDQ
jgi:hypothetical protein